MVVRAVIGALLLVMVASAPGWSQRRASGVPQPLPGAVTVTGVRVEGTQRIDPDTVRSYAGIRVGDSVDSDRLDQALRSLFATGLFQDVFVGMEASAVLVRVVENPIINRVQFEGNRRINDETLNAEVTARPRTVYTRTRIQNDVRRILEVYRRSGRFAATVEPRIIQLPQNRVDLAFEIREGAITGVNRVNFVGNRRFSDGRLREVIRTRETRWWRFLSTDDSYDPDRVAFDRELLRRHYLQSGYADFRVVSSVAELAPDREGFFITFTMDEGERYRFGNIEVVSALRDLNVDQLRRRVLTRQGAWYNADLLEQTLNALTEAAGDLGYAFVEVRPRVDRDRDNRTISVTFEIQEGQRVYVDRINIVGNVRTIDRVIRREMRLAEGDAFNATLLRRSRERIRGLSFFERVEVSNAPGETPDRTTVTVEVQERSTGELSFGIGFSTNDGPLGDVSIRERNFLGRGQDLRLSGTISGRRQQVDFSFTEPYFMDRNILAGIDIFRVERDFRRESDYRQQSTGFGLRMAYALGERLTQQWRYTLRNDRIFDVGTFASAFVREQQGSALQSLVGTDLIYDRRDDRQDPTDGYYLRLSLDVAGAGGDVRFGRARVQAGYFYPVADGWILSVTGEAAVIHGIGQSVRLQDRFFLGGDSLRGFRNAGAGPRDSATRNSLGGNQMAAATVELSFPTPMPREFGVRGLIFTDIGWLTGVDRTAATATSLLNDTGSVRVSVGFGINWRSPFGPIRVSMARAIVKEPFDILETFRFGFGTRF